MNKNDKWSIGLLNNAYSSYNMLLPLGVFSLENAPSKI